MMHKYISQEGEVYILSKDNFKLLIKLIADSQEYKLADLGTLIVPSIDYDVGDMKPSEAQEIYKDLK
jgi:hypothetical protein